MKVYCMFEQSGTFKNEFKKYGVEAVDLDILNDFGETDMIVDLFAEIEKAYNGERSIFDDIKPEDLIMAFFPCTRFEAYVPLHCRGEACQQKNYPAEKKLELSRKIFGEINDMYQRICKLFIVALRGGAEDDSRESGDTASRADSVFSGQADIRRPRPHDARRLLRQAYAVLVRQLRAEEQLLLRGLADEPREHHDDSAHTEVRPDESSQEVAH